MTTTTQRRSITATYIYRSSNNTTLYQTLQYSDGTTSCDCPGWTRRVAPDGSRTCKHTRFVEAGLGPTTAEKTVRSTAGPGSMPTQRTPLVKRLETGGERAFDFSED